jgi:hypothetical protein
MCSCNEVSSPVLAQQSINLTGIQRDLTDMDSLTKPSSLKLDSEGIVINQKENQTKTLALQP